MASLPGLGPLQSCASSVSEISAQPPSREPAAPERDAGSAAGGGPQPQRRGPPPSEPLDSLSESPGGVGDLSPIGRSPGRPWPERSG